MITYYDKNHEIEYKVENYTENQIIYNKYNENKAANDGFKIGLIAGLIFGQPAAYIFMTLIGFLK